MNRVKFLMNRFGKKLFFLIPILILLIGASYAYLTVTLTSNKVHNVVAAKLSLKLDESNTEGINLIDAEPVTDTIGLKYAPYTFTITNDGNINSDYKVYLDDIDLSDGEIRLTDNYVKYSLVKNGKTVATRLLSETGINPNRVLDSGVIKPGESYTYELKLWVDVNAPNDAQNKVFSTQIRVEGLQQTNLVYQKVFNNTNIGDLGNLDTSTGNEVYVVGTNPNNYVWYSGKLWRVISKNVSDNTVKLISQWNIATLDNENVSEWLNGTFLNSLYNYQKFIKVDSTNTVGLLALEEYNRTYKNVLESKGYLNNGLNWWLKDNNIVTANGSSNTGNSSYGVRPVITLKNDVNVKSGTGTISDPYTLLGDPSAITKAYLNTRHSGEYVKFNDNTYRIVEVNEDITKIVSIDSAGNIAFDTNGNNGYTPISDTNIGYYLNNNWYNSINESYKNMIVEGEWTSGNNKVNAKIGLIGYKELMSGQFSSNSSSYWTITSTSSGVYNITSDGKIENITSTQSSGIKPALYLNSNVYIIDGNGTLYDPYIITQSLDSSSVMKYVASFVKVDPVISIGSSSLSCKFISNNGNGCDVTLPAITVPKGYSGFWTTDQNATTGYGYGDVVKLTNNTTYYAKAIDITLPTWELANITSTGSTNKLENSDKLTIRLDGTDTSGAVFSSLTADSIKVLVDGIEVIPTIKKLSEKENITDGFRYELTIGGISGYGNLSIQILANTLSDQSGNVNENTTITTEYNVDSRNEYVAIFKKEDSVGSISSERLSCTVVDGDSCSITLPSITALNGYVVDGWYDDTNTRVGGAGDSYSLKGNIVLTAKATPKKYKVTYDYKSNGGNGVTKETDTVYYNEFVDLTPIATKDGYEFIGWSIDNSSSITLNEYKMSTSDITLFAVYKKEYMANFYYYNGTSQDIAKDTCTIYNNTSISKCEFNLPQVVSNSYGINNSIFKGVTKEVSSDAIVLNYNAYVSTDYYAYYEGTISVNYSKGTGVSSIASTMNSCDISSSTDGINYTSSSCTLNLPEIVSNTGYTVDGWYDNTNTKVGTSNSQYKFSTNQYLTAYATINKYNVTYDYKTNGGIEQNTTLELNYNQNVDLTKLATKDGYEFVGWNTNKNATEALSSLKVGTSDITLYAIFKKTVTANFYYNKNGVVTNIKDSCTIYNNTANSECKFTLPSEITTSTGTDNSTYVGMSKTANKVDPTNVYNYSVSTDYYAYYSGTWTVDYSMGNGISAIGKTKDSCANYKLTDGTVYTSTNCEIILPTITAKTGFVVSGWFNGSQNVGGPNSKYTLSENIGLEARASDTEAPVCKITSTNSVYVKDAVNAVLECTDNDPITQNVVSSSDFTLSNGNATIASVSGPVKITNGYSYDIQLDTVSTGDVLLSFNSGVIKDAAGNSNAKVDSQLITIKGRTYTATFTKQGTGVTSIGADKLSCTTSGSSLSCTVVAPAITVGTGYTAIGWNTSKTATTGIAPTNNITLNADATYYSISKKNSVTYTATFNKNGAGTQTNATGTAVGDTTVTRSCTIAEAYNNDTQATSCKITSPVLTGSTNTPVVVGYNTNKDATTSILNSNTQVSLSKNVTYYAITKKDAITYTLQYAKGSNVSSIGATSNSCTISAVYNGAAQADSCSVTLPSITPNEGYTSVGWSQTIGATTGVAASQKISLNAANNGTTYYANAAANLYKVEYYSDNSLVSSDTVKVGETYKVLTANSISLNGIWHLGYVDLTTGEITTYSGYPNAHYTDMIYLKGGVTYTLSGYGDYYEQNDSKGFLWRAYKLDGTYIGNLGTSNEWTPEVDCYVRIMYYFSSTEEQRNNSVLLASDSLSLTNVSYTFEGWKEEVSNLSWNSGFLDVNTGQAITMSSYPNAHYTDMIYLKGGVTYTLSGYGNYYNGSGEEGIRWREYSLDGSYVNSVSNTNSYTPDKDCYVKIMYYLESTEEQRKGSVISSDSVVFDSSESISNLVTGTGTIVKLNAVWVDKQKPMCEFSKINSIYVTQSDNMTLTCTDNVLVNKTNLTASDFTLSNSNMEITNVSSPVAVDNGYMYTLTLKGLSAGNSVVSLNAGVISDNSSNLNIKTNSKSVSLIKDTYTLTINPNGGTYNNSSSNTTVSQLADSTYGLLTPGKEGYSFDHWELSGSGTLQKGYSDANPAGYTGFKRTSKTDTDGSKYSNYSLNTSYTEKTWDYIRYPYYSFTAGHTYRISIMIRVNEMSNATIQLRHSAFHNDFKSIGRKNVTFSAPTDGWQEYTLERTFDGDTILDADFNSYTVEPLVEFYSGDLGNVNAVMDFDVKNLIIQDVTDSTYVFNDNDIYKFGYGNGTVTASYVDDIAPICTWSNASNVNVFSTTNLTLTCTDTGSGLPSKILATSNFKLSNSNGSVTAVSNPTAVTGGYKYDVTVKGNSVGSFNVTLNEGAITDNSGNGNKSVTSSNIGVTGRTYKATFTKNGTGVTAIGATSASCTTTGSNSTCTVTAPAITVSSGYTAIGWNTSKTATTGTAPTKSITLSADTTYFSISKKNAITYTATFNKNGAGTQTNATGTAVSDDTVTRSCTIAEVYNSTAQSTSCQITSPVLTGSTNTPNVVGYNTNKDATTSTLAQNTALSLTKNITYYAITKSNPITRTATYYLNGAGTQTNASGTAVSDATVTRSCTIAGTYNGAAQDARCTVKSPKITGSTNTPVVLGYANSADATTSSYSQESDYSIFSTSLTTFYAITKSEVKNYSVTYAKGSNVTAIGSTQGSCQIASTYNGKAQATSCEVTLPTITPNSGYTSVGWNQTNGATSGSSAGSKLAINSTNNGKTYYANAVTNTYTVEYYDGTTKKGSSGVKVDQTYTLSSASSLSLSKTGYTFKGWSEQIVNLGWHSGFLDLTTGNIINHNSYPNAHYTDLIYLKGGITYTLSGYGNYATDGFRWREYSLDGSYVGSVAENTTYTPNEDCYVRLLYFNESTEAQRNGTVISTNSVTFGDGASVKNLVTTTGSVVKLNAVWADQTAPSCSWSSLASISYGSTGTLTLSCTDTGSGISSQTLSTSSFTTSSGSGSVTAVSSPTAITNGYKYTVTVKGAAAGTFNVSLKAGVLKDKSNNSNAVKASSNITVNKVNITVSKTDYSGTYDGSNHTFTLTTTPSTNVTIYYSTSTALTSSNYTTSGSTTKPTRAATGTTTVYYYVHDTSGNYNDYASNANSNNATITVSKRAITYTAGSSTKEYDGTALTNKTATVTSGSLVSGHTATVTTSGTITNVGTATNTLSSVVIKNSGGTDVSSNYNITKVNGKLEVTKSYFNVTKTDFSGTYDWAEHTFDLIVEPSDNIEIYYSTTTELYSTNYSTDGTTTKPTRTTAGTTTVYYYIVDKSGNYTNYSSAWYENNAKITITPRGVAKPTAANYCQTLTYTGSQQTLTKTAGTGYSFSGNTGTNAGTYTVTATLKGTSYKWNDNTTADVTFQCSIGKASRTVKNTNYSGTYDAKSHTIDLTITPSNDIDIYYSTTTGLTKDNYTTGSKTKPTRTDAGTTTVYYYILDKTGNYNNYSSSYYNTNASITIAKKAVTYTAGSSTKVYDGTALTNSTSTLSSGSLISGHTATVTTSGTITNAGTAANTISSVVIKNSSGANVTANYNITKVNGTLEVTKGKFVVTNGNYSGTYDGKAHTIDLTIEPSVDVDIYYSTTAGLTMSNYTTGSTTKPTRTSAGTTTVYYYIVDKSGNFNNYSSSYYETNATITIWKKQLTKPTAADYCQTLTYKGSQQTLTKTAPTGITFSGNTGTNAGTYTVTAALSSSNFKWSDNTTDNVTFSCSIAKKAVTYTAGSTTRAYDGTALTNSTAKLTSGSLVSGHTATVTTSGTITNVGTATNTLSSVVIKNSGGTDVSSNYNITKVNGTLKITKANSTTNVTSTGGTYNGTAITAVATGIGTVTYTYYTNSSCTTKTPTSTGASAVGGAPIDAGTYYVISTRAGNSNYNGATSTCSAHTISPKSVAVSWGSTVSFTYSGSAQAPTASATSGVTGETLNVTRTTGTNVGDYTSTATLSSVTGGRAKTSNYKLTGTTKAFKITRKTPTLTLSATTGSGTVGETASFTEKANVAGKFENTGSATYATVSPASYSSVAANTAKTVTVTAKSVGTETITVKFTPTDTTNYNTASATYKFTTNAKTLWVRFSSNSSNTTNLNVVNLVSGGSGSCEVRQDKYITGTTTYSRDIVCSCTTTGANTSCNVTAPTITAPSVTPTVIGFSTSSSGRTSSWTPGATKAIDGSVTQYYAQTQKAAVTRKATFNKNGAASQTNSNGTASTATTVTRSCNIAATYNGTAQGTSCSITTPTIVGSTNTPTVVGYATSSSATSSSVSHNASLSLSSNPTYYAITKYSKTNTATFTKDSNVSAIGSTSKSCTITSYNGTAPAKTCRITLPTIRPATNYILGGWYNGSSYFGSSGGSASLSANITLTAKVNKAICKRATSVLTNYCSAGSGSNCTAGKTYNMGQVGTSGKLSVGDNFICDVNADGTYSTTDEVFFHVWYADSISYFIYSYNTKKGVKSTSSSDTIRYAGSGAYFPTLAYRWLPNRTQWSGVSLSNSMVESDDRDGTNIGATTMDLSDYSARMMRYTEVYNACSLGTYNTDISQSRCNFLFANTGLYISGYPNGYWLSSYYVINIGSHSYFSIDVSNDGIAAYSYTEKFGVRPLIEVPMNNVSY